MKSLTKFIIIVLAYSMIIFDSCSKKAILDDDDLQFKLVEIENNSSNDIIKAFPVSTEIVNSTYFNRLAEILTIVNPHQRSAEIGNLTNYYLLQNKSTSFHEAKNDVIISHEERCILQSLLKILKTSNESSISIVDYYINQIPCLKIKDETKNNCIEKLTFLKDVLIFFNFDMADQLMNNNGNNLKLTSDTKAKKWDCLYRDCFDCCMYYKLKAIEDGNVVDWVFFIATLPSTMTYFIATCSYDCVFSN